MEFLHPAVHVACGSVIVALKSWQWIRQVAAPCNVATPERPPYCNSTSGFNFGHITAVSPHVILHQSAKFLSKSDHPRQKKMTSCRFSRWRISAILNFSQPIIGSLKSPCMTSFYRSSIDTIALNCLVFEFLWKSRFCILATDRQTNRQTNRWRSPSVRLSVCLSVCRQNTKTR